VPDRPAVEVDGLVVSFRRRGGDPVRAVDGLSLAAPAGAITAVLGRNGAGKTTTVEACEGYRRPTAGSLRVLGRDPATDAADLHARVGVMLQEGGVPGAATWPQALRHAAALYAHPHEPAALADRLELGSLARTPYRRLSGGEQQRVRLALALVGRPELVFLDEPTSGLDPHARRDVWGLLTDLRAAGVTVVLTTHQLDEAERLADHVVIVDGGRAVAAGSPAELTASAAGPRSLEDVFLTLTARGDR
jgi:ABC-2 type transport system ATP-binding protein